jgi:glycine/D-amino acid oxidase-like deaminating enzyme
LSSPPHNLDQQRSLWRATAPEMPPLAPLSEDISADVVVIGGGFTGSSAALHLAQQGAKTVLLEAEDIGYGGSGRNVGLVNAGLWLQPNTVLDRLGQDYGRRVISLLGQAPDLVFDLIARHQIQCEAVREGTLHCAPNRRGEADLRQRVAQWQALSAPVRLLDRKETHRLTGSPLYRCALLDPRAGTIQPLAYVRGLATASLNAGARLFIHSPVTAWQSLGNAWQIESGGGRVRTDWIVVATGAYTLGLQPKIRAQQIHLPYFNFATDPLPEPVRAVVLPGKQGIWDTRMVLRSFRLDRDGRLIVGSVGSLAGRHQRVHHAWARRLLQRAFPMLGRVEFPYAWDGMIDMTADQVPHLHQFAPRIIAINGYNGRGIGPGTLFGRELARYAAGTISEQELPLPFTEPQSVASRGVRETLYRLGSLAVHWAG